eukprot:6490571-Amphidinium_carterae.2
MAEKCLSARCSNDHSHAIVTSIGKVLNESCRGHKSALDPSHTRIAGQCNWADELEATEKALAFVPRTSSTRASGLRVHTDTCRPRRNRTLKQLHLKCMPQAQKDLGTPGAPDIPQDEQIMRESVAPPCEQDETKETSSVGSSDPMPLQGGTDHQA